MMIELHTGKYIHNMKNWKIEISCTNEEEAVSLIKWMADAFKIAVATNLPMESMMAEKGESKISCILLSEGLIFISEAEWNKVSNEAEFFGKLSSSKFRCGSIRVYDSIMHSLESMAISAIGRRDELIIEM